MIKVTNHDGGYRVLMDGTYDTLGQEVAGCIEEIVCNIHKDVMKELGKDDADKIAVMTYLEIFMQAQARIFDKSGLNVLSTDTFAKPKADPFTMGLSGKALASFLGIFKGE